MEENESEMDAFLEISRIWEDDDMIELNIVAFNGTFRGETQVYTIEDQVREWKRALVNFPTGQANEVTFQAGEKGSYAYASIRAYPISGYRKCAMQVILESKVPTDFRKEEKDRIELEFGFEPSALDQFLPNLERLSNEPNATATLKGVVKQAITSRVR